MEKTQEKVNRIGRDFTLWQLIAFALPAILTNLCQQLFHSLDDGLFVSRYVGEDALSSISLLGPTNCIVMACAQLLAVGASTISAQKMGRGEQEEAKRIFTRMVIVGALLGVAFAIVFNVFCDPICRFLGADEAHIANSRIYVRIVYSDTPFNILVAIFAAYYSTAGKPVMGLVCSILNGAMNIIFDIIFIPVLKLGVIGSSLSTVLGEIAVGIVGLVFYANKSHEITFVPPKKDYLKTVGAAWKAGFSQFINSISFSVMGYVTNKTLLSVIGSDGVAANTVINDLRTILNAAFVGYVTCVGPVIAYNYGSRNVARLKKILTHNLKFWFFGTALMTVLGQLIRTPLISIFFGNDTSSDLFKMTYLGLTIEFYSVMFTCGCIFVMRMFVALGSPKTASILTTTRNLVVRFIMIIILPWLFGEIGIWLAIPLAEFFSFCIGLVLVIANAKNYGYGPSGIALRMQDEITSEEMKSIIEAAGDDSDE